MSCSTSSTIRPDRCVDHDLRGMPRRHDVRPDPALDKRPARGRTLVEETLPRGGLPRHDNGEHIEPLLLPTHPVEQRGDLVLFGVVDAHGMPVTAVAVTISAVSSIVSGLPALNGQTYSVVVRLLRPVQYTVAPASPSIRAMPRPAPRVAPATTATRRLSAFNIAEHYTENAQRDPPFPDSAHQEEAVSSPARARTSP